MRFLLLRKKRILTKVNWGFVPFFAKDTKLAAKMINARFETISEKPSFKGSYQKNRCVIPASGFYEWKKVNNSKQPYYISVPNREVLAFAGICEIWRDYRSCAIITMDAAPGLSGIHHRMPVVLKDDVVTSWLDPEITDKDILNDIVLNNFENNFDYYPVSKDLNYRANNSKACVEPLPENPEPEQFL